MILTHMAQVGRQKGIDVLATGDWTHPLWIKEIKSYLTEAEEGLYKMKHATSQNNTARFLLSTEISCIYSQDGKGRRVHNLVLVPSFATAEKINHELVKRGCNLSSDGRPIIGLSSQNLLELILSVDERSLLIPCHVWTPWFGVYGKMSGFDSLKEAFGDLSDKVYGIETGLSSDPEMNWQMRELDTRSILSFSDAHSLAKMGREATVFRLKGLSYDNIYQAVIAPSKKEKNSANQVLYTVEFYPEEGKYHYSGHRKCGVMYTPEDTAAKGDICPVCKRKLTDGVMRRLQELASEEKSGKHIAQADGAVWIEDPKRIHPPFVKLVPLHEIIAEAIQRPVSSPRVQELLSKLYNILGSELHILLQTDLSDIEKVAGKKVAEGVRKVRREDIVIQPGYDGVYGTVKIWTGGKDVAKDTDQAMTTDVAQMGIDF